MDSHAVSYRHSRQDRSRLALQKVLGAAESVLVVKGFDDFTMTNVEDLSGNELFPYLHAPSMAQSTRAHNGFPTRRKLFFAAAEPRSGDVRRSDPWLAVGMVRVIIIVSCVHRALQGRSVEDGLTLGKLATRLETIAMSYVPGSTKTGRQ